MQEQTTSPELELLRSKELLMAQAKKLERAARLAELEAENAWKKDLPHLYGWNWYTWAKEFFDSDNKMNFLCAANQISKSSSAIRKCVEWATNLDKHKTLWKRPPSQFWYLYPTNKQVDAEFEHKWKLFLPRGVAKDHPVHGWKEFKVDRHIGGIIFNSGVTVYFKTYAQNVDSLQTGTVDALFCFVAGTLVETPLGPRPVELIKAGDLVLSKDGWKPVRYVMSREKEVLTVTFSGGRALTGTSEHPIWTENRGWVQLVDLKPGDKCVNNFRWKKKSSCSKASSIQGTQNAKTYVPEIISTGARKGCTWLFGRLCINEKFLWGMSCIIGTVTRWTIGQRISSYLPEQSTIGTTNESSGVQKKHFPASVPPAGLTSHPEAQNTKYPGGAQTNVGIPRTCSITRLLQHVRCAVLSLLTEKITGECTVLGHAAIGTKSVVYNLNVADSHTYFANGILTHNCDEELPVNLYDELIFRISESEGYFHMVFTATLGQDFWRRVIQPDGPEEELLPEAKKWVVSMYDCMQYADGTPSRWTPEKIKIVENRCKSHAEVMKRVYGHFIIDEGRKYPTFDVKKNVKPHHHVPKNWFIYAGIDVGGGGEGEGEKDPGHKSAIVFVAVSPDYRQGRLFLSWRGDDAITTASDVLDQYEKMVKENKLEVTACFRDWAAKDFATITDRLGKGFLEAEKSHTIGEDVIGVLFKNQIMVVYDTVENRKFIKEISNLKKSTKKNKAKDDLVDAFRYCVTRIPWDWSVISAGDRPKTIQLEGEAPVSEIDERRKGFNEFRDQKRAEADLEIEIEEWNELLGT